MIINEQPIRGDWGHATKHKLFSILQDGTVYEHTIQVTIRLYESYYYPVDKEIIAKHGNPVIFINCKPSKPVLKYYHDAVIGQYPVSRYGT